MNRTKLFFAGTIGNTIEIFEALIYAFLQPYITKTFFPENFRENNLLFFLTIILPFLARPLGAFYFGILGDLKGRKTVFEISMILSGMCCGLIAILPTYQNIGILSFICIVLLRFLFGFAMSGEYNNSFLYLAEHAEPKSRGYIVSWASLGTCLGILFASIASFLLTKLIEQEIIPIWSFRILFLFSMCGVYAGFKARKYLSETAEFFISFPLTEKNKPKAILSTVKKEINGQLTNIFKIILIFGFGAHLTYSLVLYAPFYLMDSNNISFNQAILLIIFYATLCSALIPIIGKLSDVMGRKFFLLSSIILSTLLYLLFFFKLANNANNANYNHLLLFYFFLAISDAMYTTGPIEAVESLPFKMRSTVNGLLLGIPTIICGALSLPYFQVFIDIAPNSPFIILPMAIPLFLILLFSKNKMFKPTYVYKYDLEKAKVK